MALSRELPHWLKDAVWGRIRISAHHNAANGVVQRVMLWQLAGYDEEARYFEDTVRRAKEKELVARSQQLVAPAFADQLGLLQQAALSRVVTALAQPEAQHDFAACASRCRSPPNSYRNSFLTAGLLPQSDFMLVLYFDNAALCCDRGKVDALAFFQERLRALVVSGTSWDTVHAVEDVSRDIDAYTNKLRSEKVHCRQHRLLVEAVVMYIKRRDHMFQSVPVHKI